MLNRQREIILNHEYNEIQWNSNEYYWGNHTYAPIHNRTWFYGVKRPACAGWKWKNRQIVDDRDNLTTNKHLWSVAFSNCNLQKSTKQNNGQPIKQQQTNKKKSWKWKKKQTQVSSSNLP